MFLPHIVARQRAAAAAAAAAAEPLQVPAGPVSPVAIVISRQCHPRIDRGTALQVLQGSTWLSFSYAHNAAESVAAFNAFGWRDRQEPERWRILCHELDLGEFQPVAIRQPAEVWT